MSEYLWFYVKVCGFVALLVVALSIGGCSQARLLSQEEAYAYCHQNTAGTALGMNPLGEDYATWMSYCNQAWVQQTLPSMALGASVIQQQQVINQQRFAQQQLSAPISCYQQGAFTTCR